MRVLVLAGDYWHDSGVLIRSLQSPFDPKEQIFDFYDQPSKVPWNKLADYNTFILAQWGKIVHDRSDDENRWMNLEIENIIEDYVNNGGGLFILHSALSEQSETGIFRKIVKGHFIHHPNEQQKILLERVCNVHPVLDGIEDFSLIDEQYFVDVDKNDTDVLMYASSEAGTSAAAWSHFYGNGKVFALTLGHTEAVLKDRMVQKLFRNGIFYISKKH